MTQLLKTDAKEGTGNEAAAGRRVTVHYTGWLYDEAKSDHKGRKFDSSKDRNEPFDFRLGAGEVIRGWDEGVAGMKVGGQRTLTIPPDMGYGARGAGGVIPPNATSCSTWSCSTSADADAGDIVEIDALDVAGDGVSTTGRRTIASRSRFRASGFACGSPRGPARTASFPRTSSTSCTPRRIASRPAAGTSARSRRAATPAAAVRGSTSRIPSSSVSRPRSSPGWCRTRCREPPRR